MRENPDYRGDMFIAHGIIEHLSHCGKEIFLLMCGRIESYL